MQLHTIKQRRIGKWRFSSTRS